MKNMKDSILEIVEIARACPENLQQICFGSLLAHFLQGLRPPVAAVERDKKADEAKATEKPADGTSGVQAAQRQKDLCFDDLHLKVKKFIQKEGITVDKLNNLFYIEADKILPLHDDLKTTRMAESQLRITLLQGFVNAISCGEFEAKIENVRAECIQRKCYDSANFTATFKNNKSLFDFTKFDKSTKSVHLSDAGKKILGDLIKELQ